MTRPASERINECIARIMAGEDVSAVARDTGANRSNLYRRLKDKGLTAPVQGRSGRPRKALPIPRPLP